MNMVAKKSTTQATENQPNRDAEAPKNQPNRDADLEKFLTTLREMKLNLYINSDNEVPSMEVPGDKVQVFYEIDSKRVKRWLFGLYREQFQRAPRDADIKVAIVFLEQLAFEQGIVLPKGEKKLHLEDDAVLSAINTWLAKTKDGKQSHRAAQVYKELKYQATFHPNSRTWPKSVAALGRKIVTLDEAGLLKAVKIAFKSEHTVAGATWTFVRTHTITDGMIGVEKSPSDAKPRSDNDLATDGNKMDLTNPAEYDDELAKAGGGKQPAQEEHPAEPKGKKQEPGIEVHHVDPVPKPEQVKVEEDN